MRNSLSHATRTGFTHVELGERCRWSSWRKPRCWSANARCVPTRKLDTRFDQPTICHKDPLAISQPRIFIAASSG